MQRQLARAHFPSWGFTGCRKRQLALEDCGASLRRQAESGLVT